jgi:REP element-mobilizing transposase RayT
MGHTYSEILVHVVFSTYQRRNLLAQDFQERPRQYMTGVARREFGEVIRIGGTDDHIHGLLRMRPDVSISTAMRKWKSLSSGWLHKTFPAAVDFAWQEGYGAFSVSPSRSDEVAAYIQSQARRHQVRTFEEEFIALLKAHGIAYDPQGIRA